ncbi:MAG: thiol peroxidase [Candidatus Sumerlaeota bacterium]|nr:thiol peroxidase [Candidatus Sumerlaeota bacterium]
MTDRTVTFKGSPLKIVGNPVKEGDKAPDFEALDNGLAPVKFSSLKGKTVVICSVPSLDTSVCDLEMRRFNTEAAKLGPNVQILCISADLPFAQKRWCGAAGANAVMTLSDHREVAFGKAYGVLIESWRLLARAVFVIDKSGVVRHAQLVPEISQEPDYKAALDATAQCL